MGVARGKAIRIHPLGIVNVCTHVHCSPSKGELVVLIMLYHVICTPAARSVLILLLWGCRCLSVDHLASSPQSELKYVINLNRLSNSSAFFLLLISHFRFGRKARGFQFHSKSSSLKSSLMVLVSLNKFKLSTNVHLPGTVKQFLREQGPRLSLLWKTTYNSNQPSVSASDGTAWSLSCCLP